MSWKIGDRLPIHGSVGTKMIDAYDIVVEGSDGPMIIGRDHDAESRKSIAAAWESLHKPSPTAPSIPKLSPEPETHSEEKQP